jgi:predicted tellurium resistance membrane protein TerC
LEHLLTTENAIAFLTLASLEIVLGIDNIVFISILTGKLPQEQQARGRTLGLALAMGMRIALLFAISWVMGLTAPLFEVLGHEISGRDLILLVGGLFLIGKATFEIHERLEGGGHDDDTAKRTASFVSVLVQIAILDMVFSLDSVITAVGMADDLGVMVTAVVLSMIVMLVFVNPICAFVDRHPTVKMLALSFLLLIGMALVGDGCGFHIPKGYIYFAMGFSLFVEALNLRVKAKGRVV